MRPVNLGNSGQANNGFDGKHFRRRSKVSQICGSQIGRGKEKEVYFVQPLDDPEHVDERREAMGLSPLQFYVENWDMNWDVEAYKKDLAEREAKK